MIKVSNYNYTLILDISTCGEFTYDDIYDKQVTLYTKSLKEAIITIVHRLEYIHKSIDTYIRSSYIESMAKSMINDVIQDIKVHYNDGTITKRGAYHINNYSHNYSVKVSVEKFTPKKLQQCFVG